MKSIQMKLTVTILIIFLIALSTLGGLNYWKARDIVYRMIIDEINVLASNSANDIDDWMVAHQYEIAALSLAPTFQTGNMEHILPFLRTAAKANRRFSAFGYVNTGGIGYDSNGMAINLSAREYFNRVMQGEQAISDPVISPATGALVAVFASPVKTSEGNVVGMFFGAVELNEISQKIGEVKIGKTGYAYMLKRDGVTIASPNKNLIMKDNPVKNEKLPVSLRQTAERMIKGETGLTIYEYDGVEKMVAFAPVKSTHWSLGVSLPVAEAMEELKALTYISIVTILIVLVIATGFILWFARNIAKPIQRLESAANMIAGGDLSQMDLGIRSADEIGRLSKSFETMSKNVRTLIKQISSEAEQLAASSEELTASAEQSSQVTTQVAISIQEVAGGAVEQMSAANAAVANVTQMSARIQEIAANAISVSGQTEAAADKAVKGGTAVNQVVYQMNKIDQAVNSSAEVVLNLGERSMEIDQIVDVISGIAGQTNLLALNAAIEAARAGEQGRGFAVVAEEVRKLAEQSEEAAKKISRLISGIQTDTDKAVQVMQLGTQEMKAGTEAVNAAGSAFQEIVGLVTEVYEQVKQISVAIQEMATGSEQIVASVSKIDNLSKKSACESQSVSAATQEQSASMEEIAASSQALAKLAENLQQAVSKFRV